MSRQARHIPEEEIERLKRETDLVALIQARGIELKRQGNNWTGFCPFHEDRNTPNLVVTPAKGLFRCMAAGCGKSGNAIQFVQWHDGVSFRHAFELLTSGVALEPGDAAAGAASGQGMRQQKASVPKLPCPLSRDAEGAKLLSEVADFYHERLLQSPLALKYLATRGLDDEGLIRRFRIGFADRTLGLRLPQKNRAAGRELRTRLMDLGVLRQSGHEHLTGRIIVPIPDPRTGDVVQLYGRRIEGNAPKDSRHRYLSRPLAGVFNPKALEEREIILCESFLDALTFARHGMEAVTSTFGTANFTEELFEAIREAGVEEVRLAFDGDIAGDAATEEAVKRLREIGVACWRVAFPWGHDANGYAVEQGGGALRVLVREAEWLGAGTGPEVDLAKVGEVSKVGEPVVDGAECDHDEDQSASSSIKVAASSLAANPLAAGAAKNLAAKEEERLEEPEVDPTPHPRAEPPSQEPEPEADTPVTLPAAPRVNAEKKGEHWEVVFGERCYRVGGLEKNGSYEVLKITLRLLVRHSPQGDGGMEPGGLFHVDSLDLYRDGERRRFVDRAAEETRIGPDIIKRDLGKLLLTLEQLQEERLSRPVDGPTEPVVELTAEERNEALELLRSKDLLTTLVESFVGAGIVGEQTNVLAAYLACTSRKLARPLAVIIQSTSAAGKTTLMEAVLSFFPGEEQIKYSAMTGQSLYYLGETNLKHKILAIVEEEGAEKASYALKLLQSEGELTIASTGKDPQSGRMKTEEYHVEGPVAIVFTTTSIDIDEELMNRCLVLTVDESREQTERIHQSQREARTVEGIVAAENRAEVLRVMQNAQRLLRPWKIANPYAQELTFTARGTRTRRDHEKYLTLIDAITLLHQYQRRTIKRSVGGGRVVEMLPVTVEDIEAANRIAPEVLGRGLDELPAHTRNLLETIKDLVCRQMREREIDQPQCRFSRRDIREATSWSYMQIKRHLERLCEHEYLAVRGGRNGSAFQYELLIDAGQPREPWQVGLIESDRLREKHEYKGDLTTQMPDLTTKKERLTTPYQSVW